MEIFREFYIDGNGMEFNLFTATLHIKQSLGVIRTDILSRVRQE